MDTHLLLLCMLFCPILIPIDVRRQILEKIQNTTYYEKPSSGVALFRADGRTDGLDEPDSHLTKLICKRA